MRMWLVNPYDPLPTDTGFRPMRYQMLAEELLRRGSKVTWITSDFLHASKRYRTPGPLPAAWAGLQVVSLHTRPYRRNVDWGRFINHRQYCAGLRRWLRNRTPPDGILVTYPLPEAALACLLYAREHGVPVVVDVQDLWPEVFLTAFPKAMRGLAKALLAPAFGEARRVFELADRCVAVSQGYLDYAQSYRTGGHFSYSQVYYLGYDRRKDGPAGDGAAMPELAGLNRNDTILIFSGTLGHSHDIGCVLQAAQAVAPLHPRAKFVIVGQGPQKEHWIAQSRRMNLQNVLFTGFVDKACLAALLRRSLAGLVTYTADGLQSVSYKPIEYMAFGLPLINSLPGEMREMVDREPLGVSYVAGDASSLASAIGRLLADPALLETCRERVRQAFEERFSAQVIYPRYAEDLERLFGRGLERPALHRGMQQALAGHP